MTLPGEAAVMATYARYPVTLVRGEGLRVWDEGGRTYLDMVGGLGALSLGHCHPAFVEAVDRAAGTIGLTSNLFPTPPQAELAARLVDQVALFRAPLRLGGRGSRPAFGGPDPRRVDEALRLEAVPDEPAFPWPWLPRFELWAPVRRWKRR